MDTPLIRRTLTYLAIIAIILGACRPASPTPISQPTAAQQATPTTQPETQATPTQIFTGPKLLTFVFPQEFDTLNPLFTTIWLSSATQQLWNCWAWDFDDQNNPRPLLVKEIPSAENGGISSDGRVITMSLRDELVWSDGTALTSADFLFTYQMAVDTNNSIPPNSPYLAVEKLETPDERTVIITFKDPYAPWLSTLWHGLLPAHILKAAFDSSGTINAAEWNKNPTVGCGPFVFTEWVTGSHVRFVANEKYWLGKPKVSEITIKFFADEATQIDDLKAGSADLGTFFAFDKIAELESAGVQIITVNSGYNEGWFFYLDPVKGHPALQDVRVRQAIAMALDRASLANDLLVGLTKPAVSYWDNTPYIDPALQPWPYDPDKAKSLLDEAGWIDSNGDNVRDKDGIDLVLDYGTTNRQVRKDTQARAQQQLAAIGIRLELFNYELGIFLSGYAAGGPAATGQLDIFQYSVKSDFPDPNTPDFLCSEIPSMDVQAGRNWSAFCDQELDNLFKLQATQVDFKDRQATFQKISKLIFEKVYFLGLWQDPDLWGISSRLVGVRISGVTPFYNIMEWDVTR